MTVCGWCIGAICAGIATLINPEEVLNLEMLAMELITFFVVQAVAGIMIAIRLRFEGEKGRIVLPIAILIIFAICYTIGSFLKANLELKESILNVIGGTGDLEIAIALIVLSLLVWYASYRYSMRVMRKERVLKIGIRQKLKKNIDLKYYFCKQMESLKIEYPEHVLTKLTNGKLI